MDCHMCTVCRSLSRASLLFGVVMVLLILTPMKATSKHLPEEECRPRPVVLPVDPENHGFKPYHIELYRCSGTCSNSPPSHKPCRPSSSNEITLDLTDLTSGAPGIVKVVNHTQCACNCELQCDGDQGEIPDSENCRCVTFPDPGKTGKRVDNNTVDVLPYQVGMAVVGFFALCVLVVDMIMCGKDKGVLHKVTEKCGCNSDKTDNKDVPMKNGNCTSSKGSSRPEEAHV